MSSDPFNDNKNLPPWLRDVSLPPRPRDQDAPSASAQPTPPERALPGQFDSGIGAAPTAPAAPTSEPGALPDWLRESQAASAPTPGGGEQLPSWLRDIAGPLEPEAPPAAPASASAPSEAGLPDWLRDSGPEAAPASSEQLPDWLRDIAGDTSSPSAPQPPSEPPSWQANQPEEASPASDIPDWLRDQANEPGAAAASPPALDDLFAEPSEPAGAPPSWLGGANDTAATPAEAPASASEPALPNWLQDTSANSEEIDSAVEPFTFESSTGAAPSSQAGALPSWLGADTADDTSAAIPDWLAGGEQPAPADDQAGAQGPPSWLAEAGSPAEEPAETPGRPDVPLWLQDIDQGAAPTTSEPASAAPTQPSPDEQTPAWLQDTAAAPPPGEAESLPSWLQDTATAAPPPSENLPSWLQDTSPAEHQPSAEAMPAWLQDSAAAAPPPSADIPAWLQDTSPAEPPSAQNMPSWVEDQAQAAPPSEDVPAWLQERAETAPPPPSEDVPSWLQDTSPAEPAPPAGDLPAWLQDRTPPDQPAAPATGAPPEAPAAMSPEADSLPDWLRPTNVPPPPTAGAPGEAQDIPPWLRDEAGEPLPTAGAPGDTNLPAWLRGATIERTPAPPADQPPAPQTGSTSLDWFADEPATATPQASASSADNELVGGIELPAWLRPPEPEQPKEISPTDARSLDWLTRLGGHEEEEIASVAAAPAIKLTPPSAPTRTAAQLEAIALLQRLATDLYPTAEPIPEASTPTLWRRFGFERLLYLLLLIGLIAGLALPISGSLGLNLPPAAPGAQDLFTRIDQLSANDTVLVGYEWDARRSGELRPLEQAVMSHLIQRKVKLVLVSTDAQGTLLQFDLRDKLGEAGYKPSGEDYILLGYKPGAELALRSLAQDVRGALRSDFQGNDATSSGLATNPGGQPRLNSLGDFAMVLVLADEPADVQGWMEQVHSSATRADGSFVPFGFLLPAETTPIVQPYLSQLNIYHLAGKQGALAYQQLRGDSGATAEQLAGQAGQQRLSLLIYLALFLLGALGVGVNRAVTLGRKQA